MTEASRRATMEKASHDQLSMRFGALTYSKNGEADASSKDQGHGFGYGYKQLRRILPVSRGGH